MRRISVFGSTGSIGQNTLDLIGRSPEQWQVVALTGGGNIELLAAQARDFNAEIAITAYDSRYQDLKTALAGTGIKVAAGADAVEAAGARPVDIVMSAIVGAAGLPPGLAALKQGATLALANKESLVTAGGLIMDVAAQHNARILPVDSEHSAVFQALVGEDMAAVERIIITASGGAFRDWSLERMQNASVAAASSHPNWDMGQRITIDSASLFNKALELIETHEYFRIDPKQIEVLVHPQSLIHALVGFRDGALMAHLGAPDMRHAIGYALNWPERRDLPVARLDLAQIGQLEFRTPDEVRYPALRLAREVMQAGGLSGAVFNGAKEAALDAFIAGQIGFMEMAVLVEKTLDSGHDFGVMTLDNVRAADHMARMRVREMIKAGV
ncbi:MAG TPA: 1-deoxy-D-xylulose-5-phosphate reductoisomerase [Aliiroseovarius sp.]|nr:1-deoxy-D-xylulose-5-phosphate reductoisomerase [Aliiroseovarius sp.]